MKNLILYLLLFCTSYISLIAKNQNCTEENYEIKVTDDFASANTGETITISVLENDEGTDLQIIKAVSHLDCGLILDVNYDENTITYRPTMSSYCELDSIEYQVKDSCENLETGFVVIDLEPNKNLIVEVERDCTNENETGIYTLSVTITEGVAPFTIFGSLNGELEDFGSISEEFGDWTPYEINVVDAAGNDFFEYGGEYSCGAICQDFKRLHIKDIYQIIECNCDGSMEFHFEGMELDDDIPLGTFYIGWYNYPIKIGTKIPYDAYIQASSFYTENGCYSFYVGGEGGIFGDVSDFCSIRTPPTPTLNEAESQRYVCDTPIILHIEGGGEGAIYNWYYSYAPPYYPTIPATPSTGQTWLNNEIIGHQSILAVSTDINGCPSKPLSINFYRSEKLEIQDKHIEVNDSCNSYQVSFTILGGNGLYELEGQTITSNFSSKWISLEEDYSFTIEDDAQACEAITINGIAPEVDCFPVGINDFNYSSTSSIPNIHLFPNPNKGNFTLSLESKQAEEINIEIYDVVGRVKTRRHLQGSATFEREDFNLNLESGLYFIRLSGKDWTWTEKMVVE